MAEILMEILGDKLCLPSEMAVGWLMDPDEADAALLTYALTHLLARSPTHSHLLALASRAVLQTY